MESSLRQSEKAGNNQGVLLRAVALSLALHALVLGGLVPAPESELPAASVLPATGLNATLSRPAALVSPSTSTPAAASPAPSFRAAAALVRHPPQPATDAAAEARAAAPAVPDEVGVVAKGAHAPVPDNFSRGRAMPESKSGTLVLDVERDLDAAGLRQYRLALAGEARRFRHYPEVARRAGITGTAEVRLTIGTAGTRHHAELARSSGHAVLDAAAIEMLQRAAERARLPGSLEGRNFAVLLPVVFEVEE